MKNHPRVKTFVRQSLRALALVAALAGSLMANAQQAFHTPEQASQALVEALGAGQANEARLKALLGEDWRRFIPREGVQRSDVDAFLAQYREQHRIDTISASQALLSVGKDHWTLPIPLIKGVDGWRFDPQAGSAEIRTRRIGRNELAAVQSVLAYHDAQMDYALQDHNGNGVLEYARRIFSTPGQHDGLYWADTGDGQISPLGPMFGQAVAGDGWQGYRFRILEGQGPSAPGGAYSYLIGDRMSRGFALVAWPVKYGESGVMSFMISHEGQVFEKDLGPSSEQLAKSMERFDPDDSWKTVTVDQEQHD